MLRAGGGRRGGGIWLGRHWRALEGQAGGDGILPIAGVSGTRLRDNMEVGEPFRRRGLGSFLVLELKRACYELGAVPCARCSPDNGCDKHSFHSSV